MCSSTTKRQILIFSLTLFGLLGFLPKVFAQCNPSSLEIPNNGVDEDCDGLDGIFFNIPPKAYLTQGESFEFYFRNIILSTHPQDYIFEVQTTLPGVFSASKWSFTPTAAHIGAFPLTVLVKNHQGQTLASGTTVLHISSSQSPLTSVPTKILLLGHSFIDQGYVPYYFDELVKKPGTTPVQYFGSRPHWFTPYLRYESLGGVGWRWFASDPSSPLVFGGQLDVKRYFDAKICQDCKPDVLVISLDINDFCGYSLLTSSSSLTAIDDTIQTIWTQFSDPFIQAVRAYAPNCKIAISMVPPANAHTDAFNITFANIPALRDQWRWKKIVSRIHEKSIAKFGNREQENLFLLPVHLDFDDLNDYSALDAVHPIPPNGNVFSENGYKEIAKSTFSWFKYILNPSTTVPNTVDLNLQISSTPSAPSVYSTFKATYTVRNDGTQTARGVQVRCPKNTTAVNYSSATPFTASKGDFRWYSDFIWTVGDLPPQSSASLTVDYYLFSPNAAILYAEVQAASPADSDSSPGNGNGTSALEDDEAVLQIQGNTAPVCSIWASYSPPTCSDNGTPNSPSDDTFQSNILISGNNVGNLGWTAVLGSSNLTGQYGSPTSTGLRPIAQGALNLIIRDAASSGCVTTLTIPPPSAPCVVVGTDTIKTDVRLRISGGAASASAFSYTSNVITVENFSNVAATGVKIHLANPLEVVYNSSGIATVTKGTYNWWTDEWMIESLAPYEKATLTVNYYTLTQAPLPFFAEITAISPVNLHSTAGNGDEISVHEPDEALFVLNQSANPLPCWLSATLSDVVCNDQGTPNNQEDDMFTAKILVSGQSLSGRWTSSYDNNPIFGNYNTAEPIGPFPIRNGQFVLTIRDGFNNACSTQIAVIPPAACSVGQNANCASASNFPWHEWISRIQIGNFQNSSDKSTFSDFSNKKIAMVRNQNTPISLRASYSYFTYDENWRIWIDYNHDGVFNDNTEVAFSGFLSKPSPGAGANKSILGQIKIPTTALLGEAKMRVAMKRGGTLSPCGEFDFGEVEDYTVQILATSPTGEPHFGAPLESGAAFFEPKTIENWEQTPTISSILFPNPTANAVTVWLKKPQGSTGYYQLFDAFGRERMRQDLPQSADAVQEFHVSVSNLDAGVYTFVLHALGQRPSVQKLVVVRD